MNTALTIFDQKYDRDQFAVVVDKMFQNHWDVSRHYLEQGAKTKVTSGNRVYKPYQQYVQSYSRLQVLTQGESSGKTIVVIWEVKLKSANQLSNPRIYLRNFIAHLAKESQEPIDAALVAFFAEDAQDWRLSLVTTPSSRQTDKDLIPATRYTYRVGKGVPSHTVQKQLFQDAAENAPNRVESLGSLVKMFSVEQVTKEFYDEYRKLHKDFCDAAAAQIPDAVARKDFANRLLGQLLFLYFLQKKGWLGVAQGEPWGRGDIDFLRHQLETAEKATSAKSYYLAVLVPLFNEALARDRGGEQWYDRLGCRIPFLNGGLFSGGGDHDGIKLSNTLFAEVFAVFDRYNFTVIEDSDVDLEVAIDPEMLGHIFESMLSNDERHSTGTYYTPRKVVHFMTRTSLYEYLCTNVTDQSEALRKKLGELTQFWSQRTEELYDNSGTGKYKDAKIFTPEQAAEIETLLKAVRVCDPAVGSGAFLLGMLQEVVGMRTYLYALLHDGALPRGRDRRLDAILHNLYGVDIASGAVAITRLRLWLALVVDSQDYESVDPLPNLDYRVVEGDSLKGFPFTYGDWIFESSVEQITSMKNTYYSITDPKAKHRLRASIDEHLESCYVSAGKANKSRNKWEVNFDHRIHFAEVSSRGGFDIVIGNPPYIRQEDITDDDKDTYKALFPEFFTGKADIYVYFFARAVEMLRDGGHFALITSNKYAKTSYGEKLRGQLATHHGIKYFIDLATQPVFESATVDTAIAVVQKNASVDTITTSQPPFSKRAESISSVCFGKDVFLILSQEESALYEKMLLAGTPLGDWQDTKINFGIKTGFNETFYIDTAKRAELIAQDPKSAEIIKPLIRGRYSKHWYSPRSDEWIIFTRQGIDIDQYPAIKQHLSQYRADLTPKTSNNQAQGRKGGAYKWYEIQDKVAYFIHFDQPKIVFPDINSKCIFMLDTLGLYPDATCNFIVGNDIYYQLAVLNSFLLRWYYHHRLTTLGAKGFRFKIDKTILIPIPVPSAAQKEQLEGLAHNLHTWCSDSAARNKAKIAKAEEEVNSIVEHMFGLTDAEVALYREFLAG
ncbi:MAG: Eco57I restriction-modification methylase domain-containing protein, partial [Alphaproteobacteria bacterium]|nr:Eco57I restriction-modification methylase domain-containing protein [Alphaproteobacteria bacterium]